MSTVSRRSRSRRSTYLARPRLRPRVGSAVELPPSPGEEGPFGVVARLRQRLVVGLAGGRQATRPPQQGGARGGSGRIPPRARVADARGGGRRPDDLGEGDGAIERDDGSGSQREE